MKPIKYCILAILSLVLFCSCTGSDDDPVVESWSEGDAPLSYRAMSPQQTRAENDFTTQYDLYTLAVYHKGARWAVGYYSRGFQKMTCSEDKGFYYMKGFFYPVSGQMKLLSYGVPTGKSIKAKPDPIQEDRNNLVRTAMALVLDSVGGKPFDGSFAVIAADSLNVVCSLNLIQEHLPYARFHFIQTHINFKFMWADGVNAELKSRLKIDSVRIENTPCQGEFHMRGMVADGWWENLGPDAVLTKDNKTPQAIPTGAGAQLDFGSIYVVPQAKRQRIVVSYTIQNGNNNAEDERITMNYVVQDRTQAEKEKGWLPGHDYTYIIKIGESGEFTINSVKVENFKPGNVGKTEIN